MSAIAIKTANLMEGLAEHEQNIIFEFAKLMHDKLREARNAEYLSIVQGAIDRLNAGDGVVREIIEVSDVYENLRNDIEENETFELWHKKMKELMMQSIDEELPDIYFQRNKEMRTVIL